MRTEGELGPENRLSLQTRSLTNEKVVVIALKKTMHEICTSLLNIEQYLQRLAIDVEDF